MDDWFNRFSIQFMGYENACIDIGIFTKFVQLPWNCEFFRFFVVGLIEKSPIPIEKCLFVDFFFKIKA